MLAMTLRQEDQLNQLNLDRTFLLFIQAGKSFRHRRPGMANESKARSIDHSVS